MSYDVANILFAGPCNQCCPYCIGHQIDSALNEPNLDHFPLRNMDRFLTLLRQHRIEQIILTGTNTDPQLYRHEARLIQYLRQVPGIQLSLHTNGQRALDKLATFNMYDRVTISFPSFDPGTFFKMTGVRRMPDLQAICEAAHVPIKLSCLLSEDNIDQIGELIARCRQLGISRLALREQFGAPLPAVTRPLDMRQVGTYGGNPVYRMHGVQITYWQFEQTTLSTLNLFSDGTISTKYLLAKTSASLCRRSSKTTATYRRPPGPAGPR